MYFIIPDYGPGRIAGTPHLNTLLRKMHDSEDPRVKRVYRERPGRRSEFQFSNPASSVQRLQSNLLIVTTGQRGENIESNENIR